MSDAGSDDRLPWLAPTPPARPATAARRARTPLLLLLGLFCFSAIAVIAYVAGRGLTPAAPRAPDPPATVAPAPAPVAAPTPRPQAPPRIAAAPSAHVVPAAPTAAPPKTSLKPEARTTRRRETARAAPAVRVQRARPPARVAQRYRWPPSFAAAPSGRVVQLGAYPSGHQTMAAWLRLRRAYPHLATLPRKVVISAPRAGRPRYYRLRIGTRTPGEARALCQALHRIGRGCIVV